MSPGLHGLRATHRRQAMLGGSKLAVLHVCCISAMLAPAWALSSSGGEQQAITADSRVLNQEASRFELTGGSIKTADGDCLSATAPGQGARVLVQMCEGSRAQHWTHEQRSGQMLSHEGLCLDVGGAGGEVLLSACERGLGAQSWTYDTEEGRLQNEDGLCMESGGREGGGAVLARACGHGQAPEEQAWSLVATGLGPPEGAKTTTTSTSSTTTAAQKIAHKITSTTSTKTTTTTTRTWPTTTTSSTTTFFTTNMDLLAMTTTLPPVGACLDSVETGVRFRGGERAACSDLVNYCEHPRLGHKIKVACAKTCGRCDLSTLGALFMHHCVDREMNVTPVITIRGVPQVCSNLQEFCTGHPDSEYVLRKCPATCLFCHPEPATTTRIRYTFSTSFVDATASGMGCQRRRRFGFCNTRRRRGL